MGEADAEGLRADRGQSTLEYALVLFAFLSFLLALGLLWHAARDGRLMRLAAEAASHAQSQGLTRFLQDLTGF